MRGKGWAAALALAALLGGCTPAPAPESFAPAPTPEPLPTATLSPVYTDWSKLEPYAPPQVKYTRRQEEFMDRLIPGPDYGAVIPFAGSCLTLEESWYGYYDPYTLYGLVTPEGMVVADPVFTSAYALEERDIHGNIVSVPGVYLLSKLFPDPDGGEPEEWSALCAADGSWCTDFLYSYDWEMMMTLSFDAGIALPCRGGGVALVDPYSGTELQRLDCSAWLTETAYWNGIYADPQEGYITANLYDWQADVFTALLFDPQGERVALPAEVEWVGQCAQGLVPARVMEADVSSWYGYLDAHTGQWAIPPVFRDVESFSHGVAPVSDGQNGYFIDKTGKALTGGYPTQFEKHGDYWYFRRQEDWSIAAVFDAEGRPVDSPLPSLGSSISFQPQGWASARTEEGTFLVRGKEVHSFPAELGWLSDFWEDRLLFQQEGEEGNIITLVSLSGEKLGCWEGESSAYFTPDELTGEMYILLYEYQNRPSSKYYDLDGRPLFSITGYGSPRGELLYRSEEGYTTLTDREGRLVFGWTFLPAED